MIHLWMAPAAAWPCQQRSIQPRLLAVWSTGVRIAASKSGLAFLQPFQISANGSRGLRLRFIGDDQEKAAPRFELGIKDLQSSALPRWPCRPKGTMQPVWPRGIAGLIVMQSLTQRCRHERGGSTVILKGGTQIRTGDKGFAILCLTIAMPPPGNSCPHQGIVSAMHLALCCFSATATAKDHPADHPSCIGGSAPDRAALVGAGGRMLLFTKMTRLGPKAACPVVASATKA